MCATTRNCRAAASTTSAFTNVVPEQVQRLDSVEHVSDLRRVGQAAARDVAVEHFAGFLGAGQ